MWSFGGQEVDEVGKVVINSEGTHKALAFMKEFWEAACDPGGFAWDDTSNNRAFLGQTIGATLNGASIYFVAKNTPDQYPGFAEKLDHFLNPEGPSGRFHFVGPRTLSIMKYSQNKEAAAEYIRWSAQEDNFERVHDREPGLHPGRDAEVGDPPGLAVRSGDRDLRDQSALRPHAPATPARGTGSRARPRRSTSSSTCSPARRAARIRRRSRPGRRASSRTSTAHDVSLR